MVSSCVNHLRPYTMMSPSSSPCASVPRVSNLPSTVNLLSSMNFSSTCGVVCLAIPPLPTWKLTKRKNLLPSRVEEAQVPLVRRGKWAVAVPPGCLSTTVVHGARCFSTTSVPEESTAGVPGMASLIKSAMVVMKREYGAFGGATLEKSKLDLSTSQAQASTPQLEDGGGSGGIGNKNNHGGGDGGDEDGDDDDYFGDDDGGDDGDEGGFFGRRILVPELFDRKIVEAVLEEWYMTISNLPAGIRQAVEMGLMSTAQVVRFISINARPTVSRAISRTLPSNVSRAFIGKVLADPSFVYKVALEQATIIGLGVWWEIRNRGDRLKDEWGLAASNILTMSVCNAAAVWCLAPSRSYGQIFKFEWQNALQKLPSNCFAMSYPLREFSRQQRIATFFYKSLELGLIGVVSGASGAVLARTLPHPNEPCVPMPSISTSAWSYGALMGLSANLRYQCLYGAEQVMQQSFNSIGLVIFCSTASRILNIQIGDVSRLLWLGLNSTTDALEPEGLTKAYHRPSLSADSVAQWVIPKRGVISGFLEEIFHQTKELRQNQPSNIFAKRKVKRKVTVGR